MGTTSRTASILTAVLLLAVQQSSSKCVMWTESGRLVERGSSPSVFCHFAQKCSQKNITSDHPQQTYGKFNASTIWVKLVNVTEKTVFLCQCGSPDSFECGLDLAAGYPPDRPENMLCRYISANTSKRDVHCTWDRGRKTHITTTTQLYFRVKSKSGLTSETCVNSTTGGAKFSVPEDAEVISVRVQTQNHLGAAESIIWNYTLSHIAKPPPPVLAQPNCLSRACTAEPTQVTGIQHLEIQHRTAANHQKWKTVKSSNVSSLEPNTRYDFRARWRFRTGYWSEWSASVAGSTQEEAPAGPLDVWWIEQGGESLHVYWKEMNSSSARGKVLKYIVEVKQLNFIKNISTHNRNTSVRFCPHCEVAVSACNSKGCSPPASITYHKKGPTLDLMFQAHNNSLSLTWPQSKAEVIENVVEWYREGHRLDEVQWARLGSAEHQAVITNVQPFQCYEGAVYVFYRGNVRTQTFRAAILETVPTVGPSVQDNIKENKVMVTWAEIPGGQRGGCIVKYNVYLEDSLGHLLNYSLPASRKNFTKSDLPPATYSLWMSASTAEGEGPAGRKIKFFISADNKLSVGLACVLLLVLVLILLILCQCSTLRQRLWATVKYFYEDAPDPANSNWAKECSQKKGTIDVQLQLSEEGFTEDLPILAVIEELPQKTWEPTDCSNPPGQNYPAITYIQCHSHDSESSGHTELSQGTTEVYIFSHQPGSQEEEEEGEDEEELEDMLGSFSNSFMDAQECGGTLTLDAVKINVGGLF